MTKLKSKNLSGVKLSGIQEQVLSYVVSKAEKEHSFLVELDRSAIVAEFNIKGTGTISKVFCRLEDYGLIKSLGGSSYKLSSNFFEFVENKDSAYNTDNKMELTAEDFLPVAEWLQSDTEEDNQSYCIAYRTLKDNKNCFTENERLVAKAYLLDKVNRHGLDTVVDTINRTCNNTDMEELICLIS